MVLRIAVRSRRSASWRLVRRGACALAIAFGLALGLPLGVPAPALAQQRLISSDPPPKAKQRARPQTKDTLRATKGRTGDPKMLVQAAEVVYDYQREQVSAVGNVQIYYDGAVLEADKVTHDRKSDRLFAYGNVRYKTKQGHIVYGETLELTADFRDGFVRSMLVETPEQTRFAAAHGVRTEGKLNIFQSGIYTACEPCKDDPKKPPLWQVKAARIIHDEGEKRVYYENSTIEFFGFPVAYFPYFSHPDPTVRRASGFLAPNYFANSRVGTGIEIPYFWALAPHYDLTLSVAPITRQIGPLVKGEWRHRLMSGAYLIRAAGIYQQDKTAFPALYPGDRSLGQHEFRGSIETTGEFRINRKWLWGWDATLASDRAFLWDYPVSPNLSGWERVSRTYLTGQGERSHFDVRAMTFLGFSQLDHQQQLPLVHPVMDYSYILGRPVLGGELGFRMNLTSVSREMAEFVPTTQIAATNAVGSIGPNCDITKVGFNPAAANCFLRANPGDYTRGSGEMSWRRTITNAMGIVFKPFASARVDLATRGVDGSNPAVGAFTTTGRDTLARVMPAVGMETRWPFISVHSWGTQIVEPIAQVIVRPNETQIGRFPNEDAHSLVFDDTNLFSIDKYSGYDRVEGGTRANVGVQYTANIHRYGMVNVLFGQSYHLAGTNSFAFSGYVDPLTGQQTGPGLQSGLENNVSDYVARAYFQPTDKLFLASRFRFDRNTFEMRRLELETRFTWDRLAFSTIYARYDAQPLVGYFRRREGLYQTAAYRLHDNWSLFGGLRYDLDNRYIDFGMIGLNYIDECFAASFSYSGYFSHLVGTRPVHQLMLRINLRTVGGTVVSTQIADR